MSKSTILDSQRRSGRTNPAGTRRNQQEVRGQDRAGVKSAEAAAVLDVRRPGPRRTQPTLRSMHRQRVNTSQSSHPAILEARPAKPPAFNATNPALTVTLPTELPELSSEAVYAIVALIRGAVASKRVSGERAA